MNKLKILDQHGKIDCLVVLFHFCIIAAAINGSLTFLPLVALFSAIAIEIRTHLSTKQNGSDIVDKLAELETEISAIRIGQGMRRLE